MEKPIKLLLSTAFFGFMVMIMVVFSVNNTETFIEGDGSRLDVINTILGVLLLISSLIFVYQLIKFGKETPKDVDDEEDDYVGI